MGEEFGGRTTAFAHIYNYCISKGRGGIYGFKGAFLGLRRSRFCGCLRVTGGTLSKAVKGGLLRLGFPVRRRRINNHRRVLVTLHTSGLRSRGLLSAFCSLMVSACSRTKGCLVILFRSTCSIVDQADSGGGLSRSRRICRCLVYTVYPISLSGPKLNFLRRRRQVKPHIHS